LHRGSEGWEEDRVRAYVLIQTDARAEPVADVLRAIPGVISAHDLSGAFDAIALTSSASTRSLMDGVVAEIRAVPSVVRALPAPLVQSAGQPGRPEPATGHEAA
jgi:hypothetical protein